MGVDAQMAVRLLEPISDAELVAASYRLGEANGAYDTFFVSDDKDMERGEARRALNRITSEEDRYFSGGRGDDPTRWLWVSLWGRYYGEGYERGNLWSYIAIAEWLERNFIGCTVFYGGDSDGNLEVFDKAARERLIAHWADKGRRPYYAGEGKSYGKWYSAESPLRPTCPLCQYPATQYGSGGKYASWTCDGCSRHWVWVGEDVRAYPPCRQFDSFDAANKQRQEAPTTQADG